MRIKRFKRTRRTKSGKKVTEMVTRKSKNIGGIDVAYANKQLEAMFKAKSVPYKHQELVDAVNKHFSKKDIDAYKKRKNKKC
jgi:hypothetical protein